MKFRPTSCLPKAFGPSTDERQTENPEARHQAKLNPHGTDVFAHAALQNLNEKLQPSLHGRRRLSKVSAAIEERLDPRGDAENFAAQGKPPMNGYRTGLDGVFKNRADDGFSVAVGNGTFVQRTRDEISTHALLQSHLKANFGDASINAGEVITLADIEATGGFAHRRNPLAQSVARQKGKDTTPLPDPGPPSSSPILSTNPASPDKAVRFLKKGSAISTHGTPPLSPEPASPPLQGPVPKPVQTPIRDRAVSANSLNQVALRLRIWLQSLQGKQNALTDGDQLHWKERAVDWQTALPEPIAESAEEDAAASRSRAGQRRSARKAESARRTTVVSPVANQPVADQPVESKLLAIYSNAQGNFEFHDADKRNGHLSNLWVGKPVRIDGEDWTSVEHYLQAKKFDNDPRLSPQLQERQSAIRGQIKNAATPAETKVIAYRARGAAKCRMPDAEWIRKREDFLRTAVQAKFGQDDTLKNALIATGTAALIERMSQDISGGLRGAILGEGQNKLGEILSTVRKSLAG